MNIKEYFKHLSIVIIGILVAYWLSNLGSNNHAKRTRNQVLQTILNEIKENNSSIDTTIKSFDTLFAACSSIKNNDNKANKITIKHIGLNLKDIGYEAAKYTGIFNDLDYELTSIIVENYESQKSIKDNERLIIEELFVLIKDDSVKTNEINYLLLRMDNLRHHLNNITTEQKELIKILEEETQ